jgi:FdhD protein
VSDTSKEFTIEKVALSGSDKQPDHVAREEPLEIRVEGQSVAVVMRSPGHDRELAAGFLLSEGVVTKPGDIFEISECPARADHPEEEGNLIDVLLTEGNAVDLAGLTRHVFSSSSCGICGKATIESVFGNFPKIATQTKISATALAAYPDKLRATQPAFDKTGGLHASAIFDTTGEIVVLREDVGRHNALDKVIGYALLENKLPLSGHTLMLSGRISFELMQKALAAGIPTVAGISAPSSLAVEFARESGQTLVGFLRGETMNVYAGQLDGSAPIEIDPV